MAASKRLFESVAETFRQEWIAILDQNARGETERAAASFDTLSSIIGNIKGDFYQDNIHFDGTKFNDAVYGENYVYGVWHGGPSYSVIDFMDGMERWEDLEGAKDSLRNRYDGSDYETRVKDDHVYLNSTYVQTPAVTHDSYIDLYSAKRVGLELQISDEPYSRLFFGPRGGVRQESF